ncbi:MAG: hypothetical protein Q8N77_05810 [Nanoarchaeota archaeon]|nr:hypothetical protein [Nanoarchaeota archaeon]
MKIPQTFIPKNRSNLDNIVKSWIQPVKIKDLKDFILKSPHLFDKGKFNKNCYSPVHRLTAFYADYLKQSWVSEGIEINYDYDSIFVDILKFKSNALLEKNTEKIVTCAAYPNQFVSTYKRSVMIKDEYALFISYPTHDLSRKDYITAVYRQKFGFKEL